MDQFEIAAYCTGFRRMPVCWLIVLFCMMLTACHPLDLSPLDVFRRPGDKVEWVQIPAGPFRMGALEGDDDEEPVHAVILDRFWISRFETTNDQYQRCVRAGDCDPIEAELPLGARKPVVNVNWYEARDYCAWLGGRLPTEAEWEKAARGGLEDQKYPWGDEQVSCEPSTLNGAQFGYCAGDLLDVGSFSPNGYGLFDMAGNAWEWVSDWYNKGYYQIADKTNPPGPESGEYKVIRGGGWNYSVYGLRVAYRSVSYPDSRANFIGFRCVHENQPR